MRVVAAALLSVAALSMPQVAHADRAPIHEGGDRSACVTAHEWDLVNIGDPASTVQRIFDTDGHKVGKRRYAELVSFEVGQPVETVPAQYRVVRRYDTCLPGFALVEFNRHEHKVAGSYYEVTSDPNAAPIG